MRLACSTPLEVAGLHPDAKGDARDPADVVVDLAGAPAHRAEPAHRIVEPTGGWLEVSPRGSGRGGGANLRFGYADQHVHFEIGPGGAEVAASWSPAVLPAHVATLLLSTVMGYLLHLQGRPALHAGVVAWNGAAYAFAGDSGAGKSTTVGALVRRGGAVVSDDVAALACGPGGWAVFPGPPGIRLAPDVQAMFGDAGAAATPVWSASPLMADNAFQQVEDKSLVVPAAVAPDADGTPGPLRLAGIFLLPPRSDRRDAPQIVALPRAAAVPLLGAHVLTPAWVRRTADRAQFLTLADLARTTPVRVVERPDRLDAVPALCDALLDEMDRLR